MGFIWSLIVGGIIGAVAGAITNKGSSMGIIADVVAGLVGSTLDQTLLGSWGPNIVGMVIVPSLVGAITLVLIVSFFAREL